MKNFGTIDLVLGDVQKLVRGKEEWPQGGMVNKYGKNQFNCIILSKCTTESHESVPMICIKKYHRFRSKVYHFEDKTSYRP